MILWLIAHTLREASAPWMSALWYYNVAGLGFFAITLGLGNTGGGFGILFGPPVVLGTGLTAAAFGYVVSALAQLWRSR